MDRSAPGLVDVVPGEWIDQPDGFRSVGFRGYLSGLQLAGEMKDCPYTGFAHAIELHGTA